MANTFTNFTIILAAVFITQASPQRPASPQSDDQLTNDQKQEIFDKIDLNEDGFISKREFRKMIKAVNKGQEEPIEDLTNSKIKELFDSLDKDSNKKLSPQEFTGYDGQKRNSIIDGGLTGNIIYIFVVINNYYGCPKCGTQTVNILEEKKFEVKCSSWRYKYATCSLENKINEVCEEVNGCFSSKITNMIVKKKQSRSACTESSSFGKSDDTTIWVSDGCRAIFTVSVHFSYTETNIGTNMVEKKVEVKCSSWNYKYATCSLENKIKEVCEEVNGCSSSKITNIIVKEKQSRSACTESTSFGKSDETTIWVSDGCRAIFTISVRIQTNKGK